MGFRFQYITLLFLFPFLDAVSQDSTLVINFEAGADFIGSKYEEKDYLRQISNQNTGIFGPRILSEIHKSFAGVKLEKKTANHKFSFSTGVRFTHLTSSIKKSGSPDFFYLLLRQTGTTTEYLEVKELMEISGYLGIPLEACFYVPSQRSFRFYFMAGGEWSYRLSTKADVVFTKSAMEVYEPDVEDIIRKPEAWYATVYARAGFIVGKERPLISLGLTAPIVITNTVSTLNMPIAGAGFQIQLHLPVKHKRL